MHLSRIAQYVKVLVNEQAISFRFCYKHLPWMNKEYSLCDVKRILHPDILFFNIDAHLALHVLVASSNTTPT